MPVLRAHASVMTKTFLSGAQHLGTLRFFQFKFEVQCEMDENKQKEAGMGPYLKIS